LQPKPSKKLLTDAAQSDLSNVPVWVWALLIAVVITLLVVGVFWLIRRRRRRVAQPEVETQLVPRLRNIWLGFVRSMPRRVRRSLVLFQPYVVLGEAGSGKSALIERCTDWKGLAAQYHTSLVTDPSMQVYRGTACIVEEHAATTLVNTSPGLRKELRRLWRRMRRTKPPRAILVFDATALLSQPMERLVRQAQLMRGKLNILSESLDQPVRATVALTHLDQVVGYVPLAEFLAERDHPLCLPVDRDRPLDSIRDLMRPLEGFLPHLMAHALPNDYLNAQKFLLESDTLVQRVSSVVEVLTSYDPATHEPIITDICLTSDKDSAEGFANPLNAVITNREVADFRPTRRHRIIAAAVAAAGVFYILAGYLYERQTIARANEILAPLDETSSKSSQLTILGSFEAFVQRQRNLPLVGLLPSYRADHPDHLEQDIHLRYINGIRDKLILPRLDELGDTRDSRSQIKYVYFLALTYARNDNELGRLVLDNIDRWSDETGFGKLLLEDYVRYNDFTRSVGAQLSEEALQSLLNPEIIVKWADFFTRVGAALERPFLDLSEIGRLHERAKEIRSEIENNRLDQAVDRSQELIELIELLTAAKHLDVASNWRSQLGKLSAGDMATILEVLADIERRGVPEIDVSNQTLMDVVNNLGVMQNVDESKAKPARFAITGRRFSLNMATWENLVNHSQLVASLREMTTMIREEPAWKSALFPANTLYRGPALEPEIGDATIFTGRASVDGLFTQRAYEDHIKNLVTALPPFIEALPIPDEEKGPFSEFVVTTLEQYATEYTSAYGTFYRAHRYGDMNSAVLPYVALQLQSDRSPVNALLKTVVDNTSFEIDEENPYAVALSRVPKQFAFARALADDSKGPNPNVAAYSDLVRGLAQELSSTEPFVPKNPEDETVALKERLSPVGRVALDIFRGEPGSYQQRLDNWLRAANIDRQWQEPFVGVFRAAYRNGKREIEGIVSSEWETLYSKYVLPVRRSFPSRPGTKNALSIKALQDSIGPAGAFWRGVKDYLVPVLRLDEGTWRRRRSRYSPVQLPGQLLFFLNGAQQFRNTLWDDAGQPKPLVVEFRAQPLPTSDRAVRPVLVHLQTGSTSVFGFNQKPAWQPVSVEWWQPSSSMIEIAFAQAGQKARTYRRVSVGESSWSLHRLFMKSSGSSVTGSGTRLWTWQVTEPTRERRPVRVRFETRQDPWEGIRF